MTYEILEGDCIDWMRDMLEKSINCCVTSPPYWGLRDYGVDGQLGLESSPQEYVEKMVAVFREVRRVLRDDGTLWLNIGDSYTSGGRGTWNAGDNPLGQHGAQHGMSRVDTPNGLKPKDLVGIPWRVAFALQADGWYLRQDIIWAKPNPMPESVRDRCTKSHEYIFLLSKSEKYYYDYKSIAEPFAQSSIDRLEQPTLEQRESQAAGEPRSYNGSSFTRGKTAKVKPNVGQGHRVEAMGRNKRSVWTVTTQPFKEAHFATFPPKLIEPCILAGCPEGGTVLDPFGGAGTTALVTMRNKRKSVIIELNPKYCDMAEQRLIRASESLPKTGT